MEVLTTTLNRHVKGLPKVEVFLDSKERRSNSKQTRNSYLTSLIHFSEFISAKYSKYDIETILKPLISNKIDRYELLDGFISYESKKAVLSVKSRIQHLAIVKSYL